VLNMKTCDFCGKDQEKVPIMIAAKTVDICAECVCTCMEVLVKEMKSNIKEIPFPEKE
jgi:ATP-dependent protease Clp ATPase subunit